jgi:hypothetical protein
MVGLICNPKGDRIQLAIYDINGNIGKFNDISDFSNNFWNLHPDQLAIVEVYIFDNGKLAITNLSTIQVYDNEIDSIYKVHKLIKTTEINRYCNDLFEDQIEQEHSKLLQPTYH